MNLENTKVYTTDPEVIRKYAELCGVIVRVGDDIQKNGRVPVGIASCPNDCFTFSEFWDGIHGSKRATITPDQINKLHADKFGTQNTDLMPCDPWDDVFVKFATGDLSVGAAGDFNWQNVTEWGMVKKMNTDQIAVTEQEDEAFEAMSEEWKNGDECVYDGYDYVFVGMTPTFNDVSCIIFSSKNGIEHVSVNKLRKLETPQQREERERLEAAYDLHCEWCGASLGKDTCSIEVFEYLAVCKKWLAIVDKTGYRKGESK